MRKDFLESTVEFLDAIEKPIVLLDDDYRIIAVNQCYDKTFGNSEAMVGTYGEVKTGYECFTLPLSQEDVGKKKYTCMVIEGKAREEEIDSVTGIANRYGLNRFYKMINGPLFFDYICFEVENYLFVKELHGSEMANIYINQAWKKIAGVFEEKEAFFSRILGGQFVAVMRSDIISEKKIEQYCRKIVAEFEHGVPCKDMKIETVINMGIVMNQDAADSLDDILHKTKLALGHSKSSGCSSYVFYHEIESELIEKKEMEAAMAGALEKGEFVPYFQPKMNALTNTLYGAEALVRWISPEKGFIMPGKFIPLMERNGFIREIDFSILEQVCRMKRKWKDEQRPYADLIVSVNMSRMHFFDGDFVSRLLHIVNESGISTNEIDLEITENVFFEKIEVIKRTICELKEKGFLISIDDFGSGYSTLGMLKDVQADILKLDKTFIEAAGTDRKGAAIIRNVISMGTDLHMKVISEGIETEEEKKLVTGFGCEVIQGFYYSRPVPQGEFEAYAEKTFEKNVAGLYLPLETDAVSSLGDVEGIVEGGAISFEGGAVFPGGGELENVIILPNEVIVSESYTVSLWIMPYENHKWASTFFIRYRYGFMSIVPYIKEGRAVFRICDDRSDSGWHDILYEPIPLNQWTQIAVTMDADSQMARLYLNGELFCYLENVPGMNCVEKVVVGGDYYQNSFEGKIKNLRISGVVESSEKIRQIYLQEKEI